MLDVRSVSPSARNNFSDFAAKLLLRVVASLKSTQAKLKGEASQSEGARRLHVWAFSQ